MSAPPLTMGQLLAAVGDLEVERRTLLHYVAQLEARVAELERELELRPDAGEGGR